jgi:transposase-like protein
MRSVLLSVLAFDVESRKVICSTNAIESVNAGDPARHPWLHGSGPF